MSEHSELIDKAISLSIRLADDLYPGGEEAEQTVDGLIDIIAEYKTACLGIIDPKTTVPELVEACRIADVALTGLAEHEPQSAVGKALWAQMREAQRAIRAVLAKTTKPEPTEKGERDGVHE